MKLEIISTSILSKTRNVEGECECGECFDCKEQCGECITDPPVPPYPKP